MPWLPIYLTKRDSEDLLNWVSNEDDISQIIPNGKGKWIAVDKFVDTKNHRICFWHNKSGSLPLVTKKQKKMKKIKNPHAGWNEIVAGQDSSVPYFGTGDVGIFWLNLKVNNTSCIEMSSFEWIGNHYSVLGREAPLVTKKWWERLRRWVKKNSTQIPRVGDNFDEKKEIYAFQYALKEIKNGKSREVNSV